MKKFLVIADKIKESQDAFEKALVLARKTGAAIHVLIFEYELKAVLTAISAENPDFIGADLKTQMMNRNKHWWKEYIQKHRGDLEITHEVTWSKYIHDWVIKHVEKYRYDLVVSPEVRVVR